MTGGPENHPGQRDRTFTITRVFDAPRSLVYDAFTKPGHLIHWHHAGQGWTTPFAEVDARPGGRLRIGYASPGGDESFVLEGTYREVTPGRIVYVIEDRAITITLEDVGQRTKVTLVVTMETEYAEDLQRAGWSEHLDNLAAYIGTLGR